MSAPLTTPRPPRILVIAPDEDLRHSLAFMLFAEGFEVEESPAWPPDSNSAGCDAMIIDHAGLDRRKSADSQLVAMAHKAIILASKWTPFPALRQATVIRKPLLDGAVVETLRAALAGSQAPT